MSRGCTTGHHGRLWQWALETLSAVTSVALIAALVVVLMYYNGKPIFDSAHITLNSLVSALSTLSKATLLFAIQSAIGQWNWILFADHPRRLYDFERVASASTGPLGGVQLLFNSNLLDGKLVRFGALVTILAAVLDPFTQQLLHLNQEMRFVPDSHGTTSIPRASKYSNGNRFQLFNPTKINRDGRMSIVKGNDGSPTSSQVIVADADFMLQSATIFGSTASRSSILQQVAFECPSSECIFPPVTSLSVCSQCADISSSLEKHALEDAGQYYNLIPDGSYDQEGGGTEYKLPNGLSLNNIDNTVGGDYMVYMTTLGTSNTSKTVAMGHIDTLIWSHSIIKVDGNRESKNKWPNYRVSASECALYYCVKNYTSNVRNGTLFETSTILEDQRRVADSWSIEDQSKSEGISDVVVQSLGFNTIESSIPRSDLQLGHSNSNLSWNLSQVAVDGISSFMQKTFAVCLNTTCADILDDWFPVNGYYVDGAGSPDEPVDPNSPPERYQPSSAKLLWDTNDFNETFDNIAMSMSNAIRNGGDNSETTRGSLGVPTTVYAVDWRWIVLHIATELGGLVFLTLTILATMRKKGLRAPVWKTSQMAVLSRGFVVRDILKDSETVKELEKKAKAVSIALIDGGSGMKTEDDQALPLVDVGAYQRQELVDES